MAKPRALFSSSRTRASNHGRSSDLRASSRLGNPEVQRPRRTDVTGRSEQGPLLQFEIALDQRWAELAGFDIEAEDAALPELLEAGPPGRQQLFRGGPFVGARHPLDRRAAGR